jgi:hypothetical protein
MTNDYSYIAHRRAVRSASVSRSSAALSMGTSSSARGLTAGGGTAASATTGSSPPGFRSSALANTRSHLRFRLRRSPPAWPVLRFRVFGCRPARRWLRFAKLCYHRKWFLHENVAPALVPGFRAPNLGWSPLPGAVFRRMDLRDQGRLRAPRPRPRSATRSPFRHGRGALHHVCGTGFQPVSVASFRKIASLSQTINGNRFKIDDSPPASDWPAADDSNPALDSRSGDLRSGVSARSETFAEPGASASARSWSRVSLCWARVSGSTELAEVRPRPSPERRSPVS